MLCRLSCLFSRHGIHILTLDKFSTKASYSSHYSSLFSRLNATSTMSCRVPDPFDEEDEAQLAHAVALSLQDMGGGKTDPIMVSSSSDEEGDGLDRPLEANPEAFGAGKITGTRRSGSPNTDSGLASLPGPVTGLRGLDRKKMEEERLARVKRRRTQDSDMESQGRMPRLKPSTSQWSESAAVPHQNASRTRQATSGTRTPARAFTSSDAATYQLPYPKGVVKRTWVKGCDRTGNDIKIEEVLQKEQLKLAVLSSYQWDEDWLMSKIDLAKTKLLLLAYAPDDATVRLSSPAHKPRTGGILALKLLSG